MLKRQRNDEKQAGTEAFMIGKIKNVNNQTGKYLNSGTAIFCHNKKQPMANIWIVEKEMEKKTIFYKCQ